MNVTLWRRIPKARKLDGPSVLLLLFWIFAFAHYGYRYLLGYGGSFAVPGYSPTPLAFQIIKDVALAALALAALALVLKRRGATGLTRAYFPVALLIALALSAGLASSLWNAAEGGALAETLLLGFRYPWLYALVIVLAPVFVAPARVGRFFFRFADLAFWLSLPYWLVQVALYYGTGRLPWNSYPGSPRFGGILDDPNGYGIFCVLLVAIMLSGPVRYRGFKLVMLTTMILMTVSLSSYGALVLLALLIAGRALLVRGMRGERLRAAPAYALISLALTALAGLALLLASPTTAAAAQAERWWEGKLPSVRLHIEDFFDSSMQVMSTDAGTFLLGNARSFSENYYLYLWQNTGLIGVLLLAAVLAPLLWLTLTAREPLYRNLGFFALTVLVASNVIPYLRVYPINFFFWGALGLAAHALLGRRATGSATGSATEHVAEHVAPESAAPTAQRPGAA